MKLPAFQFYPGDWRKDPGIQALSFHDRGVWFEILCLMHESEERGKLTLCGKPMPEDALARLLGLDKQNLTTTLTTLLTYGVTSRCEHTGALVSRRMVRDEKLRKVRAEAGKQGGNPALLKQIPTTVDNQKSTPSSSSSSSSSTNTIDHSVIEAVWSAYPRKVGKKKACTIIASLLKKGHTDLLDKVKAYAAAVATWPAGDEIYIPHPATWFNRGSYDDDPVTWQRKASKPAQAKPDRINFKTDDYSGFST